MFFVLSCFLILCGALLLGLARKRPDNRGLSLVLGVAALALIALGAVLLYLLRSGTIVLPLQ